MKKIILIFLIVSNTVYSQISPNWISVSPNPQVNIQAIAFPNTLTGYAAGDGGLIIKTTNVGKPWLTLNSGTNYDICSMYFLNINTGYAAGDFGIILKTTNGGINWQATASNTTNRITEIFFTDLLNGFASALGGKFLKTTNGGLNWTAYNISIKDLRAVYFLNPTTGFCAGDSSLILKTTNAGLNWSLRYMGMSLQFHSICFINNNTGIVANANYHYRTTDAGENWSSTSFFWGMGAQPYGDMKFINANTGFFESRGGPIFKTVNAGLNWTISGPSNVNGLGTYSISIPDSLNIYISGSLGSIYKTRADSLQFYKNIGGSGRPIFYSSFLSSTTGYMHSMGMILKTTDGGNYWDIEEHNGNNWFEPVSYEYKVIEHNGNGIVYRALSVSGNTYQMGSLYRSTNYGLTWDAPGGHWSSFTYFNDIYAIGNTGMIIIASPLPYIGQTFRVSDNGGSWVTKYTITSGQNLQRIAFANSTTGFLVNATNNSRTLIHTSDGGNNWLEFPLMINKYVVEPVLMPSGIGYIVLDTSYVLKTTNFGANWFTCFNNINYTFRTAQFINDNKGFAISKQNKLLHTSNGGVNWSIHETGAAKQLYNVNFVDINTGYLTGDSGTVLKTTNGGLTFIETMTQSSPKRYYLHQNYPNPFNPVTKILFDFPTLTKGGTKGGVVRLIIYNSIGQHIETLVNESLTPGTYEVTFDGSNYPSGVYFYNLTTDTFSESRKMLLIK